MNDFEKRSQLLLFELVERRHHTQKMSVGNVRPNAYTVINDQQRGVHIVVVENCRKILFARCTVEISQLLETQHRIDANFEEADEESGDCTGKFGGAEGNDMNVCFHGVCLLGCLLLKHWVTCIYRVAHILCEGLFCTNLSEESGDRWADEEPAQRARNTEIEVSAVCVSGLRNEY